MVEWRGKRHWPSLFISLEKRAWIHSSTGNHFNHSTSHNRFKFASPFAIGTDMLCYPTQQCQPVNPTTLLLSLYETKGSCPGGELTEGGLQAQLSFPLKAQCQCPGPWKCSPPSLGLSHELRGQSWTHTGNLSWHHIRFLTMLAHFSSMFFSSPTALW